MKYETQSTPTNPHALPLSLSRWLIHTLDAHKARARASRASRERARALGDEAEAPLSRARALSQARFAVVNALIVVSFALRIVLMGYLLAFEIVPRTALSVARPRAHGPAASRRG